jgi:hypothetical protein
VIGSGGAGTTLSHLDIRATGGQLSIPPTALAADGSVTASDLALTCNGVCASLGGLGSQLGPGVSATVTGSNFGGYGVAALAGVTVTGVTVNANSPGSTGVQLGAGALLTDAAVNAADTALLTFGGTTRRTTLNGGVTGVSAGPAAGPSVVSDSVVTSTASGGQAALASKSSSSSDVGALTLRNVTAVAGGSGASGLEAQAYAGAQFAGAPGSIDARNVIVRGAGTDLKSDPPANPCPGGDVCPAGAVKVGHSNFVTSSGAVDSGSLGHNQSTDPLLVNPVVGAGQDFHISSSSSPAIGAGTPDANDGPTDRDGVTHPNPPSIGAYEFVGSTPPPSGGNAPPAGTTAGGPTTTGGGQGTLPTKASISGLGESNTIFAVGPASTPLSAQTAARRHKRGTVFSFRVDQSATVKIAIQSTARGRRVGRRCKPDSPRLHHKPSCTRTITIATLTRTARAGINRVAFTGRIRNKALTPGRYRAALTAIDAAGASVPRSLSFTVVKR